MEALRHRAIRPSPLPVLLLVLLTALAGTAAADGRSVSARLEVEGTPALEGALRATADDATFVVGAPAEGEALALEVPRGTLRVVYLERDVVDPGSSEVALAPETRTETFDLTGARVIVRDATEEFLLLLTPAEGGRLTLDFAGGPRALGLEGEAQRFVVGNRGDYDYYFNHIIPAESFRLACEARSGPRITATGPVQVAVNGARLEVEGPDGSQSFVLGTTEDPIAGAHAYHRSNAFAVLQLEDPTLQLAPDAAIAFFSQAPTLEVQGRVTLPRASGVVQFDGTTREARGQPVEIVGTIALAGTRVAGEEGLLERRDGSSRFTVSGSAERVAIAGSPVATALEGAAVPSVALAALLLAWLTGLGPKVLALAVAPLYATATPQSVLANERRRAIYQAVLRQPGIHMRELHRDTGMRWGSLQYHTALLLGTGLLVASRAGRRTVLACDVHHLTPEQIRALHLLRSPRAQGVARTVARSTGITQRDIAEDTGVSFRLVSRYLRMMSDLGLVDLVGEGRPKRYAATPRLAELLPHAAMRGEAPPSAASVATAEPPALPPAM